jgi:hypothetical protein
MSPALKGPGRWILRFLLSLGFLAKYTIIVEVNAAALYLYTIILSPICLLLELINIWQGLNLSIWQGLNLSIWQGLNLSIWLANWFSGPTNNYAYLQT